MENKHIIIAFEGNIGAGKSTLISILQEKLKFLQSIEFVLEPVDEWEKINDKNGENILQKFYENPKKYAFSFQLLVLMSRYKMIKDKISCQSYQSYSSCKNKIILCERSVLTDHKVFAKMLYDKGYIDDIEYDIYKYNENIVKKELNFVKYIYLRTSPVKCMERINKRNRIGENISFEYVKLCEKYHDDVLLNKNSEKNNVLVIDGDHDNFNDLDESVLNNIFEFIFDNNIIV